MSDQLLTKAHTPPARGLQTIARRLRDAQKEIRSLEASLRDARRRRAKLVAKLAHGNIAERAIAAIIGVHNSRVHRWKQAAENGNGNGPAPRRVYGTPLTPSEYQLVWALIREPLTAGELATDLGGTVQKRSAELQGLASRGWVESVEGIYRATSRARRAVSW